MSCAKVSALYSYRTLSIVMCCPFVALSEVAVNLANAMLRSNYELSNSALPESAADLVLHCCVCGSSATDTTFLLDCLHCCCASCADSAATADSHGQPVDSSTRVLTCPICQELTCLSSVLGLAAVALTAQRSTVQSSPIIGPPRCAFCFEDGIVCESKHWCGDCACHMCHSCLVSHNRFNRQHVAVALPSASNGPGPFLAADVTSAATRLCARHPPSNERFCLTCGALRCATCPEGSACIEVRHDLLAVSDPRVADRIAFILEDARRAEAALLREQAALRPLLFRVAAADNDDSHLLAALDDAMHRDEAVLQANKARLLGIVDAAYSRASKALDQCYSSVKAQLRESAKSARLLQRKLEHSVTFGQAVLDASASSAGSSSRGSILHRSSLLPHLRCLAKRLRALTVECRSATAASSSSALLGTSTAVDNLVSSPVIDLCARWPTELDDVVSRCIGMPQLSSSFLGFQVEGISSSTGVELRRQQPVTADVKLDAESYDDGLGSCYSSVGSLSSITRAAAEDGASNSDDYGSGNTAPPSLFSLDPNCSPSTFRTEFKCWDMALVGKGTVMVAAYGDGLREYSADGQELSFWLPPPIPRQGRNSSNSRAGDSVIGADSSGLDSVYSVDVTADDRVVVALLRSRTLVALCRNGNAPSPDELSADAVCSGGWSEDCRIALPFHPWRMASHGSNLVAVAYARCERRKFMPGPSFELFSLSDGASLLRRTLQYNVVAVALTSGSVVVASERQQLSSDPHSRWTLVDAYSRDVGTLLWRRECNDSIFDIAAEPDTTGHRVYLALSDSRRVIAITGEEDGGSDDVVVATVCDAPVRLSLCRAGPLSALAVLLFDLRSICIYT